MATLRAEFQELADELINGEFADFKKPLVLTQVGEWDQDTQSVVGASTDNIAGIRLEFESSEIDGGKVQADDYKIILVTQDARNVDLNSINFECVFDIIKVNIKNIEHDPADAATTLHVRSK